MTALPLLVSAVALVDADGRVLVQQRAAGDTLAGLWEFPGGKVEPSESPEATAVREIAEELGVTLSARDLDPIAFASGPHASGRPLVLLLYSCCRWIGLPRCLDAAAIAWHLPDELPALPMPPLDVPLVAALRRTLRGLPTRNDPPMRPLPKRP